MYRLKENPNARGHEQRGPRFAVILQSDALLTSTVIAAPTSTSARPAAHRPEVRIGKQRTRVLVEQLQAIDPQQRFSQQAGTLTRDDMEDIDEALRRVLGLFAPW
ncbi:type II toxin-antitoxin system PemK/MazF family toxin [Saccharopolyspora sp. NPDC049426]|uniref:type II toxin-antitoxin system PemK/MazF family toxin n=1 Tax=Saccharopolyspora sp. NPDC049426 TaxID=3155652 RepID=UPI00341AAF82